MKAEETKRVYIYALRCPDTNEIRYIGKADKPKARLASHLRDALRRNRPVCNWIRALLSDGKQPVMTIEASCIGEWEPVEIALIAQYRAEGKLLNVADGGSHVPTSIETRKSNGRQLASKMKDPDVLAVRHLLCRVGLYTKPYVDSWPKEKVDRLNAAIARIKYVASIDPKIIVDIVASRPVMAAVMRGRQCPA